MTLELAPTSSTEAASDVSKYAMIYEAEMIVLGACMIESDTVREVADIVRATDFREPSAFIFNAILEVFVAGQHTYPRVIDKHLTAMGEDPTEHRTAFLKRCVSSVPFQFHEEDAVAIAITWARVVEEQAYMRRIADAARRLTNSAATGQLSATAAAFAALDAALRADGAIHSPDQAISIAAIYNEQATALYRWFDADDRLLYVGITYSLPNRQSSHAKRSSWSDFAVRATVERWPTRQEAEAYEVIAIREEHPLFNHQHNDTPEAQQRLVAYLIEQRRPDLLAPSIMRG